MHFQIFDWVEKILNWLNLGALFFVGAGGTFCLVYICLALKIHQDNIRQNRGPFSRKKIFTELLKQVIVATVLGLFCTYLAKLIILKDGVELFPVFAIVCFLLTLAQRFFYSPFANKQLHKLT